MSESIQNAMDQAKEKANEVVIAATSVPLEVPSRNISLEDFKRETPRVDAWLKIGLDGFTLRDELVKGGSEAKFKVLMKIEDFVACRRLRWGKPPVYQTSYDGVYCTDGQLWSVTIENAKRATGDRELRDYVSMNVQGQLLQDTGGCIAGEVIGYQTTQTQNKNLSTLINTVESAGVASDEFFEVTIGLKICKTTFKWAIHTYDYVGPSGG